MELRTAFQYYGKPAHYVIAPEALGIYQARLLHYAGRSGKHPPANITLVKSVKDWAGSHEESALIDALGQAIEGRVRGKDPHSV